MVIELSSKQTLEEQLASAILRSGFTPKTASISEMVENLRSCWEYDLEDVGKDYYKVQDDPISDILEYAKCVGGFQTFDFIIGEGGEIRNGE